MEHESVTTQLAQAATSSARSKMAKLRELHADIEVALASGVSYSSIAEILTSNGVGFTPDQLRRKMHIIRKEEGREKREPQKSITKSLGDAKPFTTIKKSHDPRDIDKVLSVKPDLQALSKIGKESK